MKPTLLSIAASIAAGLTWCPPAKGQSPTTYSTNLPGLSIRAGGSGGGGGGGYSSGGERGSVVRVIRHPAVCQEVGVTREQQERIYPILQRVAAAESDLLQTVDRSTADPAAARTARTGDKATQYDEANRQLAQATTRVLEVLSPAQRTLLQALCQQAKANPAAFQARIAPAQSRGGGGGGAFVGGGGGGGDGQPNSLPPSSYRSAGGLTGSGAGGGSTFVGVSGGTSGPTQTTRKDYQDGGGPGGVITVISYERVQDQLGLDANQRQQIAHTTTELRQNEEAFHRQTRPSIPKPGSEEFRQLEQRFEELRQKEAATRQVVTSAGEDILHELTPAQQKRVREICLQAQGAEALFKPEVIRELGLTATQQIKLANLRQESNTQRPPRLRDTGVPPHLNHDWVADQKRRQLETERRMLTEVLTPAQQAQLQRMRGRDFAGLSQLVPTAWAGGSGNAGFSPNRSP